MKFSRQKFLLIAGLALILFLGWGAWQLFGPGPPIVVSKATTYITAPLRPDGLPDYERYVLEKSRKGVTPENNAAVLFWQAMGPGEMNQDEFAVVAKEIGLETIPLPEDCLEKIWGDKTRERVKVWLEQEGILQPADDQQEWQELEATAESSSDEIVDNLLDQATERPWTSEKIPPLAEWVAANEEPLDLLVAASERLRFYPASPTLLNDSHESLIEMHLPGAASARPAVRSLSARAMWHLGEGRVDQAWNDILAVYRWSRLIGQGTSLVELMVSINIESTANRATMILLDNSSSAPDMARRIGEDLQTFPARKIIGELLDQFERTAILSALLSIRDDNSNDLNVGEIEGFVLATMVDWNIPLREMNIHYDELSAAVSLPMWSARSEALHAHEEYLRQIEQSVQLRRAAGGLFSRKARSEVIADIFVTLMLPATSAACQAEDRANTNLTLTKLAAALAVYRAEHGGYPASLDALVPDILDKLPTDLYHDNPFAYRRTENGYLLYSLGPNGQDDGGSNQQMGMYKTGIYKGYSTDLKPVESLQELLGDDLPMIEDESAGPDSDEPVLRPFGENDYLDEHVPAGADDISVRLPLPKLELPKAK